MTFDVSNLPRRVVERMNDKVRARWLAELHHGVLSQRRLAKKYHDIPPRPLADCAEMTMALDPRLDTLARATYGTDVVSDDPEWQPWFLKRDEHGQMARVRTRAGKAGIGYRGPVGGTSGRLDGFRRVGPGRMVKVYG